MVLSESLEEIILENPSLVDRALRQSSLIDFTAESLPNGGYKTGWVHNAICQALTRFFYDVLAGKSPRLAIFVPPRHGKSFIASERFPTWCIGNHPEMEIICCSYAAELANDFSRRALTLIESEYYKSVFPDMVLDRRKRTLRHWATTEGGGYRSAGVGGAITGAGAQILIIDDPVKNWKDALSELKRESDWRWYQSTAYTRLMPGGGVLLIQTRWHHDDLAGRLLDAMSKGEGDKWEVLNFPAIAEKNEEYRKKGEALHVDRYPTKELSRIKKAVGTKVWTSLFQQRPSAEEGEEFKKAWFKHYVNPPEIFRIVISVDAAFKEEETNDQVSVQVWGDANPDFYLLENITNHMGFSATCEVIDMLIEKLPEAPTILIEDKANGSAIIETMMRKYPGVIAVNPLGGKLSRARAITGIAEAGNIHIPKYAAWKEDYLDELCAFPFGKYDDQVDATTQALNYLLGNEEGGDFEVYTKASYSRR